jgi:hypothetical protein
LIDALFEEWVRETARGDELRCKNVECLREIERLRAELDQRTRDRGPSAQAKRNTGCDQSKKKTTHTELLVSHSSAYLGCSTEM